MDIPTIDSLHPSLWGKSMWEFVETVIVVYPRESPSIEHRDHVYHFLDNLGNLLPCAQCRSHYQSFIQRNPIGNALKNRSSLVRFYYRLRKEIAENSRENLNDIQCPEDLWKRILMRFRLNSSHSLPIQSVHYRQHQIPPRPVGGCIACQR